MSKNYKRITVSIDDLLLDTENPRFAMSLKDDTNYNQQTIINYLIENYDIIELAEGIINSEDLFESPACYTNDSNKYIVAEGNRRVCACKLLLDRSLIPDKYKKNFPVLIQDDELYKDLKNIEIKLFSDKNMLNKYLINRHIESGIKKWTSAEKNNYYNRLFNEGNSPKEISTLAQCTETAIENSLYKYHFFESVINVLKTKHTFDTVNINYLPLVDRFMMTLVDNSDVGLNLIKNETDYKYYCDESKKDIYNEILMMVGEAFFIRTVKDNPNKITSSEIFSKKQQIKLIIDNERIPGLYDLIKKYKGIQDVNNNVHTTQETPDNYGSTNNNNTTSDNTNKSNNTTNGTNTTQNEDNQRKKNNGRQTETTPKVTKINDFFGSLDTSHVQPNNFNGQGVLRVCNEIIKISRKPSFIEEYPICTAFIVRALLEQSIKYHAQKNEYWGVIMSEYKAEKSSNHNPNLGYIIDKYKKHKAEWITDENNIRRIFENTLCSGKTIDKFNLVVHTPENYTLAPSTLIDMSREGLQALINYFLL